MSYDLKPRNKNIEEISINAFRWPIILQETGMGYLLGYGRDIQPSKYIYLPRKKASPVSNDGFKVSSFEAKAMAQITRGYISVKKLINKQYESMTEIEKNEILSAKYYGEKGLVQNLYEHPVDESFIKSLEIFADFAEKSQGFEIH